MPADAPGEVVSELVARLGALNIGVGLASEVGESRNVNGGIGPSRNLGVVEIRESTARVLETEFVHSIGSNAPCILHRASDIAGPLYLLFVREQSVLTPEDRQRKWQDDPGIPCYFLNVLENRSISDAVAEKFNVQHESPQILLLKNGKCIYHNSHSGIMVPDT